jgi:hypothetical protein
MKGFVRIKNNLIEDKEMLSHLEDEYRRANISEKDYKALKEKYSNGNGKVIMSKKDQPKEEEIKEITPEVIEKLASQLNDQSTAQEVQQKEKKEKGPGFFSRLFGKKKKDDKPKPEQVVQPQAPVAENPMVEHIEEYPESRPPVPSETEKKVEGLEVEIEKLKTILETVRETGHITDETIQTISESIGELRSLVFQTDASLKETMVKMEKIEDDISQVKPKEIEKKFREIDGDTDRKNIEMEKFRTKIEDSNEKLNKMYEMLKSIGGIENLVNINKNIQEKLKDVEEAVKYIGRIGAKTEKQFMDLSRGMEDLILFKAKQEDLDNSIKDVLKSIDAVNIKFEGYVSKSDLNAFREDMFLVNKRLENLDKVLPMVDIKLPEDIVNLRKEREDIMMLLGSLQEQYEGKKISKSEYMNFKEGNEKRIKEIEKQLEKEWRKVQRGMRPETEKAPEPEAQAEERHEEKKDAAKAEEKPKDEKTEEVKHKLEEVKEAFEKKEDDEEHEEEEEEEHEKEEKPKKEKKEKAEVKKVEKPKPKPKKASTESAKKMRLLKNIKKMKI